MTQLFMDELLKEREEQGVQERMQMSRGKNGLQMWAVLLNQT